MISSFKELKTKNFTITTQMSQHVEFFHSLIFKTRDEIVTIKTTWPEDNLKGCLKKIMLLILYSSPELNDPYECSYVTHLSRFSVSDVKYH